MSAKKQKKIKAERIWFDGDAFSFDGEVSGYWRSAAKADAESPLGESTPAAIIHVHDEERLIIQATEEILDRRERGHSTCYADDAAAVLESLGIIRTKKSRRHF